MLIVTASQGCQKISVRRYLQTVKCLVCYHYHYYCFLYERVASQCRDSGGKEIHTVILPIDIHIIYTHQELKMSHAGGDHSILENYVFLAWVPAEPDPKMQVEARLCRRALETVMKKGAGLERAKPHWASIS